MSTVEADWVPFGDGGFAGASALRAWLLAVATYGVGDVATTAVLVWFSPLHREANPVVGAAIAAHGGGGLLGVKALAFGVCLGVSLRGGLDDDPFLLYLPPVTLAVVGAAATLFNLNLLL